VRRSTLGFMLAIAVGLGFFSVARAQGPDVQIVQLDCNSKPEVVVIQNRGDVAQDLTGWKLESDPPGDEVFNLFGTLKPGESTSIALGQQSVYRDDDPSDYARIVNETGGAVHQVDCAGGAAATPTPTAAARPSPTPTAGPEASPLVNVPNGGGPPPAGAALAPALMILMGGSMLAAGMAAFAIPHVRLVPSPASGHAAAPTPGPQRKGRGRHGDGAASLASRLALIEVALTVAVVIVSLFWRERSD